VTAAAEPLFQISLAQWSLNKRFLKRPGAEPLDNLEFPKIARSVGIDGVEWVNQMFFDKAEDQAYLSEMKTRADGEGVKSLLIMCDREGNLGDPDEAKRKLTVQNHLKWLDAAKSLGCHSIRVNAASDAKLPVDEQAKLAADGLHALCVEGDKRGLWVVVENHGGTSSHGKRLTNVMKLADHARVGILPDFGNFYTNREAGELYNPYQGLREFMPWVKQAVSAKAYDWDTGAGKYYTEDRLRAARNDTGLQALDRDRREGRLQRLHRHRIRRPETRRNRRHQAHQAGAGRSACGTQCLSHASARPASEQWRRSECEADRRSSVFPDRPTADAGNEGDILEGAGSEGRYGG